MSKISDLTAQLEKQSKELQESTRKELSSVFNEHTENLKRELKDSESIISADIHGTTQILRSQALLMRKAVFKTWLHLFLTILIILASMLGVLWYQGQLIANNLVEIDQQNKILESLRSQSLDIEMPTDEVDERIIQIPVK
ncbi:MbeB family mobilization protein [Shewanella aestuarii]|uniref:MobB protein n=1 Tax=Shewanella aestuarii TaxID=1028752 RepID=A0A6G9QPP2_9GAMM|nr:MbeB family mobilization protein [Shewanella aestuarii]QIR16560.1 hypothetical protein HBH39_18975 [Shewanella aestuarii]